ncbi:ABC transporter permease [Candidatus Contubernalis alkaliaceticus]|uniref:ABC transporter permease n=1 Tax=Candidatus Contubernalis alkaliaceticus TaxID=338645 RepID=UPI001F4C2FDC|nr:ABC transporter permease [Candidatus Contubernalis alkalaceticus]UNC92056.1 ABC transporter permease [Candidatus Contubernalis alkalaceticus]
MQFNICYNVRKMSLRKLRPMFKNPLSIILSMIQSIIWLLLFGSLFSKITNIPGFITDSYVTYLIPGILVMNALFAGVFLGMGTLYDIHVGVMERFLVAPVSRVALILSELVSLVIIQFIQSVIIVSIGYIIGARYSFNFFSLILFITMPIIFGMAIGTLSISAALITQKHEAMVSVMQFFTLPLMFLSSAFMSQDLMPDWMMWISRFTPVNWVVHVGRLMMEGWENWIEWASSTSLIIVFLVVCIVFCSKTFQIYQNRL